MSKIRTILVAIAVFIAGHGQGTAGAWPRGDGNVFLSFKNEAALEGPASGSALAVYGEYGLSAETTLSTQLRFPGDSSENTSGYVAFSRLIGMISDADPFAVSARLGFQEQGDQMALSLSPGVHFGHGFKTSFGNGWATLDSWFHQPLDGSESATQIDAQVGARISVNWMMMMTASRYSSATYEGTKYTPSIAFRVSTDRTIQFSYTEEYGDTPASTLEASLWMEF